MRAAYNDALCMVVLDLIVESRFLPCKLEKNRTFPEKMTKTAVYDGRWAATAAAAAPVSMTFNMLLLSPAPAMKMFLGLPTRAKLFVKFGDSQAEARFLLDTSHTDNR